MAGLVQKHGNEYGNGPCRNPPTSVDGETERGYQEEGEVDGYGDTEEWEPEHVSTIERRRPVRGASVFDHAIGSGLLVSVPFVLEADGSAERCKPLCRICRQRIVCHLGSLFAE